VCRRVILDKYLDRREWERRQYKEGEEKYNVCWDRPESEDEMEGDYKEDKGEEN
jgi:hypothetical protein